MASADEILAELASDPRISGAMKSRILAAAGVQPTAQMPALTPVPGYSIPGFSVQAPQGTVRYEANTDKDRPQDEVIGDALKAGNDLAALWSIPELVEDRVTIREPIINPNERFPTGGTPTQNTLKGGLRFRKGTLADFEGASTIPMALVDKTTGLPMKGLSIEQQEALVDQYGPDPYGALSFGNDVPVIPLDRQKYEDYQQIRNQGRAMRDQFQIPMTTIRGADSGVQIPLAAMVDESMWTTLPDAPAPGRNSPLGEDFYARFPRRDVAQPVLVPESESLKPLDSMIVEQVYNQVGRDRDKARERLIELGYRVD